MLLDEGNDERSETLIMVRDIADFDTVDRVFFPVVPDSFMRRAPGKMSVVAQGYSGGEWPEELERPLLSPRDRWSF
jgi:hypothetical protein